MIRGVFVTGTDTGVGKTLAACALVHALRKEGIDALPMKPIAAGAVEHAGGWANEDSLALLRASGADASLLPDVTPVLLREAMAPHLAARHENRFIALAPIEAAFERLSARSRFLVIEGVGGFRVPLADSLDTVDLARALALPIVLVVGMRLGCLNHALLTAEAIERSGLRFAGWIANAVDPTMAARDENVAALVDRLEAPLLGTLPHCVPPDPASLARQLDVAALLRSPG
ncbi:MAG TPA: dethiobiotin synthase [Usitatibacter sp.]